MRKVKVEAKAVNESLVDQFLIFQPEAPNPLLDPAYAPSSNLPNPDPPNSDTPSPDPLNPDPSNSDPPNVGSKPHHQEIRLNFFFISRYFTSISLLFSMQ